MLIASVVFTLIAALAAIFYIKRKGSKNTGSKNQASSNQVYVGNLHYRVQEYDLKSHFGKYGEISDIKIVKNRKTGRPKTFAFIRYQSANEAGKALTSHGQMLNERSMVVRIARAQDR